MHTVQHILQQKPQQLFFIIPGSSVYDALQYMMDKNISAVLIMDKEQPAGIFTERDYARKIILMGRSSKDTTVDEVMTRELVTVAPETGIDSCMRLMTERRIRHLPVIAAQRVTGIVSIGDLVKAVIERQQQTIEQLEQYISG